MSDDRQHCAIIERYFELAGCFGPSRAELRTPLDRPGDPLYAVWAPAV